MKHPSQPVLYIVIPCYNEQEVLPITAPLFLQKIEQLAAAGSISPDSRILFVNDGSRDKTWEIICTLAKSDPHYLGISQSRNRGHQNAVLAGLMEARCRCDITISIDCDGQDDINAMDEMVAKYLEGVDIVYGVRCDRSTDTRLKRDTAHLFYALMGWLKTPLIPDHADYRLVGRAVLEALDAFPERDIFLRGLFPSLGFSTSRVYYTRRERAAGKSKYPFWKMVCFAWKGITSCSPAPLRLSAFMGALCMLAALAYSFVSLFKYLEGETIPGWTSLIIVVLLLGSVQLFCLALLGEYVAKIFSEVKRRPRYLVEKTL